MMPRNRLTIFAMPWSCRYSWYFAMDPNIPLRPKTWKSNMSRPSKPTAAICFTKSSMSRRLAYCVCGPRGVSTRQWSM